MKRRSIRIALVVAAFTAAAVVLINARVHQAAGRELREIILAELQPVALKNCTLKRFGSANDGGYLMCENLIEPLDDQFDETAKDLDERPARTLFQRKHSLLKLRLIT